MPELSIVIVNLNNKDLVLGLIDSINKEGSKVSLEIIVVDNGSTDGSVSALRQIQIPNTHRARAPSGPAAKIQIIENKENFGYSKANNQGIKKAKGKYILLLNSDTLIINKALARLLNFAKKKKDAGVVGPKLLNRDGSTQSSVYNFPTIINALKEYWLGQAGVYEKYSPTGNNPKTIDAVVGAAFLITPIAMDRVGLLDEKYFAYFEDLDYCRRAWRKGLKVYYLPTAEVIHYHGATFKKMAKADERWKKLIPSSKIYHGFAKHYILTAIIWLGQKWKKLTKS